MRRGVGPTLSGPSTEKTGKPVAALGAHHTQRIFPLDMFPEAGLRKTLGHKHPVPTRPPINFLNLPAVEIGLRHMAAIGVDRIHERVACLTAWLLDSLLSLRHSNGAPLVRLYGPTTMQARGGTVTVNFYDPQGKLIDHRRVEELASEVNISLRAGCFCNPGAGDVAHGLTQEEMSEGFKNRDRMTFEQFLSVLERNDGKSAGAVRVSLGVVTNFADVYRFLSFAQHLLDQTAGRV